MCELYEKSHRTQPNILFKTDGKPTVRIEWPSPIKGNATGGGLPDLGAVASGILETSRLKASIYFKPGRVELPISRVRPFIVNVPKGCVAALSAELARLDDEPAVVLLTAEFAPALELPNVVETLIEVQHLFGDPAIATVTDFLSAVPREIRLLFEGIIAGLDLRQIYGADQLLVKVSKVELRLRRSGDMWELVPSFGGMIKLLGNIEFPFWDVSLPRVVLPTLKAQIRELLSDAPVASATIQAKQLDHKVVINKIIAAIKNIETDLDMVFRMPRLEFSSETGDRTNVLLSVSCPKEARVTTRVLADFANGCIRIGAPQLSMSFMGYNEKLSAKLKTTIDQGGKRVEGSLSIDRGSILPQVQLMLNTQHPLATGGSDVLIQASSLAVQGPLKFVFSKNRISVVPAGNGIKFECLFEAPEQIAVRRNKSSLTVSLDQGTINAKAKAYGGNGWDIAFDWKAALCCRLDTQVTPIPELKMDDNVLSADVAADIEVTGGALILSNVEDEGVRIVPGGHARLKVKAAQASLDNRILDIPSGTEIGLEWKGGEITPAGLGETDIEVTWDLFGKPCVLRNNNIQVHLLGEALRQGKLLLNMSPGARLTFVDGPKGLYGVRFFNAFLNPTKDLGPLLEVLKDGDALGQIVSVVEVFNTDLAQAISELRSFVERFLERLSIEGVKKPGDAIPRPMLARLLSFAINGDYSLTERLEPIIKDVTEGKGLDIDAAMDLLRGRFKGKRLDWEIAGLLRWLDIVTRPTQPFPRAQQVYEPPVVADPQYQTHVSHLPSAAEIYAIAESSNPGPLELKRISIVAPWLSLAQLDYVLDRDISSWPGEIVETLSRVRGLKRKVARVDELSGIASAAKAAFIASFIGEAVGPIEVIDGYGGENSLLGPRDVAVLLSASLATPRQAAQAQINNRLLLEMIRARPGEFLLEVLVEMGQQVPHVLSNQLFALLNQDQDEMREPLDLAALLESKLGMPVPRQTEYMAGGKRAGESYYQALSELATAILDSAGPYLAKRAWLREVRHPIPGPRRTSEGRKEAKDARKAIAAADRLGARVTDEKTRQRAVAAYRAAFAQCAEFLRVVPDGFTVPWMKSFWLRNEEALKVLSVVRNWQEDIDDVRRWLAVNAPGPFRDDEQSLTETVIRTLYAYPEDQERLLYDPLVRLLIDPDPGHYHFTIISCMGVITDGKDGRELEDAFRRVKERRGVEVIRAHTGLFRSLEYNASAIIEAIKQAKTPWGYIGYSQGCANALMAENFLYGGTPEQRKLLDNFVCRNLLFSAANGSVHGSNGARKFLTAIVEGEMFLKHYQAIYSRELTDLILRTMKAVMDSRAFVNTLGGTYSLTLERARLLHRDGQFVPWVPTSTTRGIVTLDRIPEALEYLWWMHERLLPGVPSDSQVPADEAVGHASRIRNDWTEVLRRCDMGSYVQATHHWSPVTAEIEIVTTERDIRLAVYQSPKDRHVFPWVEVNARFGRIKTTS